LRPPGGAVDFTGGHGVHYGSCRRPVGNPPDPTAERAFNLNPKRGTTMNIKRTHLLLAVTVGLGAILLAGFAARSHAQDAGLKIGPTKVAVCDLVKVFSEYDRAEALTEQLEEQRREMQAESDRREEQLSDMQTDVEQYRGEMREKAFEEWRKATMEYQVWAKMQEELILRKHLRLSREMYKEIQDTVAAVAQEQGIDLVVQLEPDDIEARNAQELISQIDRRKVLYSSDQIDITAAVILRLNKNYRVSE
jgi:Skp family chaperone for outer membrane proteins